MTNADCGLAFALGLASTPHCAAMCGPLAAACGASCPRGGVRPHAAYHAGRIATYSALGAAAGAAGQGAYLAGHAGGFERGLTVAAGVLMLCAAALLANSSWRSGGLTRLGAVPLLTRVSGYLTRPDALSKLWLGLGLGLLPCGLVWAALVPALASGSAFGGAASMAAFGAGTAVPLLSIGLAAGRWTRHFASHGTRLAAVCLLLSGAATVWRGIRLSGEEGHACRVSHANS